MTARRSEQPQLSLDAPADVPRKPRAPERAAAPVADGADPGRWVVRQIERDPDTGGRLYWSNADGWVDLADATSFGRSDRSLFHLPLGGEWRDLSSGNRPALANWRTDDHE